MASCHKTKIRCLLCTKTPTLNFAYLECEVGNVLNVHSILPGVKLQPHVGVKKNI